MKTNSMKMLVLGDEGVGKSTLVSTIISEVSNQIPKTMKKVVLPPDMCIYVKNFFTEIVDTSSATNITTQITNSDLVLLVYDVSDENSIMRLREYWMPIISEVSKDIPVVLVGNKYDKIQLEVEQSKQYMPIRDVLKSLTKNYKQVQMGIECSAFYDRNVKKVLNSAQRAILYPLRPLYDLTTKNVTLKFKKALIRIFRILDSQLTGLLSDEELINLQSRVFLSELSVEDIRAIKSIIQKQQNEYNQKSISVNGFVCFQKKCIQMLKIQICWSILRHFHYSNNLDIRQIQDGFVINYQEGQSIQFTNTAVDFLQKIYAFGDKMAKPNQSIIDKIFQCSPQIPLPQFSKQNMTREEFLLAWQLYTTLNYRKCYYDLLYIGYDKSLEETFKVTKNKMTIKNLEMIKQRNVFNIVFVQHEQYQVQLRELFKDGIQEDYLIRKPIHLQDKQSLSKVLVMFKIKQKHLKIFFNQNNQSNLSKRIDLLVYFTGWDNQQHFKISNFQISEHTMIRKITKEIAENQIKLFELPQLNLNQFPITDTNNHLERLLKFVCSTFYKIEKGYSAEYIKKIKNNGYSTQNLMIGIGSTVLALVGFLALGRRKFLG